MNWPSVIPHHTSAENRYGKFASIVPCGFTSDQKCEFLVLCVPSRIHRASPVDTMYRRRSRCRLSNTIQWQDSSRLPNRQLHGPSCQGALAQWHALVSWHIILPYHSSATAENRNPADITLFTTNDLRNNFLLGVSSWHILCVAGLQHISKRRGLNSIHWRWKLFFLITTKFRMAEGSIHPLALCKIKVIRECYWGFASVCY